MCGAVGFEVTGPSKWCAHCHCSMCRRAHGAGFVTWVGVERRSFQITRGAARLRRYHSSASASRSFCERCGSTLLFEGERWPDEVHIVRAAFEGPVDREPQAHVYYDDRAPWVEVGDGLPRRGGSSGTTPIEPGPDEGA